MDIKLLYGRRDGKIIHIDDITPEQNGKRCGCVCPACGKTGLSIDGEIDQSDPLVSQVINRYFFYLQLLGFVDQDGITFFSNQKWYSRRPISLNPRKSKAADVMKEILSSVDPCAPNVDAIIDEKLKSLYFS